VPIRVFRAKFASSYLCVGAALIRALVAMRWQQRF